MTSQTGCCHGNMQVKLYRRQAPHYVMQSLASHCRGPGLTPAGSCQIYGGQSDKETRFTASTVATNSFTRFRRPSHQISESFSKSGQT